MGTGSNNALIYDAAREAARTGNDNRLKGLVGLGIDIDSRTEYGRHSPLGFFINGKETKTARILLENGADPNQKDPYGAPIIHNAVHNNSIESVQLLVEYEADLKALDKYGDTILKSALAKYSDARPEMVNLLLELGVKPREDELSMLVEWLMDKKCYTILIKVFEEFNKAKEIK